MCYFEQMNGITDVVLFAGADRFGLRWDCEHAGAVGREDSDAVGVHLRAVPAAGRDGPVQPH